MVKKEQFNISNIKHANALSQACADSENIEWRNADVLNPFSIWFYNDFEQAEIYCKGLPVARVTSSTKFST